MKAILKAWLEAKGLENEYLVLAFEDGGILYAVTEVNLTLRIYRADALVPVVMQREEAHSSGILIAIARLVGTYPEDSDQAIFGDIGTETKGLLRFFAGIEGIREEFHVTHNPLEKLFH